MVRRARWVAVPAALLCGVLACGEGTAPARTGALRVTAATTGIDPDTDGYTLQVGLLPPRDLATDGPPTTFDLVPGRYTVVPGGVAPNCALGPGSLSAVVSAGDTSDITLAVTCSALPGTLRVSASTTGEDLDLDGYVVLVDGAERGRVPANDSLELQAVPAGPHAVALQDLAGNCAATGASPIPVAVSHSTEARVDFVIACTHTPRIVFRDRDLLKTVNQDGTGLYTLSTVLYPLDPEWSPDGRRVAFADSRGTVWIVGADGSGLTAVSTGGIHASGPAWAPDGGRLAVSLLFTSGIQTETDSAAIVVLDLAGGDPRPLTSGPSKYKEPAWSPDGTRLAFVREDTASVRHLFIANADGSGLVQVTDGVDDREPAWSPDGTLLAFTGQGPTGERRLYLVHPDGSGRESLLPLDQRTWSYSPHWSADGTQLMASGSDRLYIVDLATRQQVWSLRLFDPLQGLPMFSWRQ